jgi:hypothetical protein
MTAPRSVTCPDCGFSVEDRGPLDFSVLTGDKAAYLDRCRYLDEAPSPPTSVFYCITLRTAAKRAAVSAEIETHRPPST